MLFRSEKYILKKRDEFIDEINRSGKYLFLKEELKKSVARVAYEKYKKLGTNAMSKDQFYSELYVYLIEQMHSTIDSLVSIRSSELPEDIVMAKEIAQKQRNDIMSKVFKESITERLERLPNSIRPLKVTETYQILRNCEPNTRSLSAQTLSERGRHFSGSVSVLPECLCVC